MFRIVKSPAFLRVVLVAAAGLIPVGPPLLGWLPFPAGTLRAETYSAQDPGEQEMLPGQDPGDNEGMPRPSAKSKAKAARKKSRPSDKKTSKKADTPATKDTATPATAADTGPLKFSQDIAPILVANCTGCHSGNGQGLKRGKLDLTSFATLIKGSAAHPVVVAGKPDESSLVLRIKGEETPRMPQGGNRVLSDEAIAKIEQWVKSGATLDKGIDAKVAMETYAANPDQVLRRQMAKLSPQERDKKVEQVGLARWKQAGDKLKAPEIVHGDHFILFSNLPKERAGKDLKILEKQYGYLKSLLGSPTMDWVEKVSLFVFARKADFVEFVRTVESREVDADTVSTAKLTGAQPYVAAFDPLEGKKEEPAPRRKARSKRGDEISAGPDRTLAGVITEALGSAAVASAGEPPRWLKEGIGAFLASQVEPRSPYYRQLRQNAFAKFQQGWETKASEALGGSDKLAADDVRALSFALVESMWSSELRQGFPTFVNGMLGGAGKLDEMLKKVYDYSSRNDFLVDTGDFVATKYGQDQ
jgi:mono/diheme cytochrome c family protein